MSSSAPASVQVLVDDSDARIRYSPVSQWNAGGNDYEHNSTTHGFGEGTGSLAFSFNGTKIGVYGTVLPGNDTMDVTCTIDGVDIPVLQPDGASYHYLYCESPTLSGDEEHQLEVEVVGPSSPPFILDYLIYESEVREDRLAGPETQDIQLLVDEADPRVVYGGPEGSWRTGGVPRELGGTTHLTNTGGATVTYEFFGTGIQVFGTLGAQEEQEPYTVTFTIDDGTPISYRPPDIGGLVYKMRFFRSSVLEEGEHTLVITDTTEGTREFILDFFAQSVSPSGLIRDPDPPSPSDSPGPSDTPTPSDTPNNDGDDGGPNVGLIAGVTVGAVLVLALIVGFFLWRRRNSKKASRMSVDLSGPQVTEPFMGPGSVTPYSYNPPSQGWAAGAAGTSSGHQDVSHSGSSGYPVASTHSGSNAHPASTSSGGYPVGMVQHRNNGHPTSTTRPSSSGYPSGKGLSSRNSVPQSPTSSVHTPPPAPSSSSASAAPFGSATHQRTDSSNSLQPQRHVDGGVRLAGGNDEGDLPVDLPPMYQRSYTIRRP